MTEETATTEGHSKSKVKETEWHGFKTLQCPYCAFDSSARDDKVRTGTMSDHIHGAHPDKWMED